MSTDLRLAFRTLRRTPGFTAIAIVTVALGIGATVTVFGILEAVLLRPLPVLDPDRLVAIEAQRGRRERTPSHSFPDYLDFRDGARTLSGVAAFRIAAMGIESGTRAERAWGYLVTGNYFQTLGLRPAVGRFFTPQEDTRRAASPYAVLSYDTWQSRFGANPNVAGTTLRINGLPYTIVGVTPQGFYGTEIYYRPEIWVPMSMQPQIEGRSWLDVRSTLNANIIARMAGGVSTEQATADLNRIAAAIASAHPRSHEGLTISLAPLGIAGSYGRTPMTIFMAGVMALAVLVLLAACVNLASLMTARVVDRMREVAIRLSLGAPRLRIVRELLAEASIVSLLGATAGVVTAAVILDSLTRWRLPLAVPIQFQVTPSLAVFAWAAILTCVVPLASSVVAMRRAWRIQPARLASDPISERFGRRWSTRDLLLAGQVAVCCVLVTACAVSLKNLRSALAMPVGLDLDGVSTAGFDLALAGYVPDEGRRLQERILERVASMPHVIHAAYASSLPLTIDQSTTGAFPETGDIRPSSSVEANVYQVSPRYFDVLGTRLLSGRDFSNEDTRDRPAVAIVNQTFARKVLRTDDPVGRRFRTGATQFVQVIGLVEDGKYETLSEDPRAVMFRPASQSYNSTMVVLARSALPERDLANQLADIIGELDPRVPLLSQQSLREAVAVAFLPARAATVALSAFGAIALLLALAGVYGLAAYSVSARTRDIGICVAVGAQRSHILRFAFGRTAVLVGLGSSFGLIASTAANQVFTTVMFHASSREPAVILLVAAAMAVVGLGAAWVPARRALALDPSRTLRST